MAFTPNLAEVLPDGFSYAPRDPAKTLLYQIVQDNLATFLAMTEADPKKSLPEFVKKEFEEFLNCGILAHGFLRTQCTNCKHEKMVAFCCKLRGFCPTCCSRRMAESSALLVDQILPHQPIRQWVISFPMGIRYFLASDPKVLSKVLQITNNTISTYMIKKAGFKKADKDIKTAAITMIQRFGSSVNLNPHLHSLFVDGIYREAKFIPIPKPTDAEIEQVVTKIAHRVLRYLVKHGLLVAEDGYEYINQASHDGPTLLEQIALASVTYRIATGVRCGQKVMTLKVAPNQERRANPDLISKGRLVANLKGFSLHARTAYRREEREKIERLCQYITRPPIANSRIRINKKGQIVYKIKTPYKNGTTHVIFEPLEFMEKLASLVPRPRVNLIRFHGGLAPNAKIRKQIIPTPPEIQLTLLTDEEFPDLEKSNSKYRISWAKLLKRVFNIDITTCYKCQKGKIRIISAIHEKKTIEKILTHLGLPSKPPEPAPARAPPGFQPSLITGQTFPSYEDQPQPVDTKDFDQTPKGW